MKRSVERPKPSRALLLERQALLAEAAQASRWAAQFAPAASLSQQGSRLFERLFALSYQLAPASQRQARLADQTIERCRGRPRHATLSSTTTPTRRPFLLHCWGKK